MSIKTVRKCDVYGTGRNIKVVRLTIEVDGDKGLNREWLADLSVRGFRRLIHGIVRNLHPAGWSPEDDEEATVADPATVGMDEEIPDG